MKKFRDFEHYEPTIINGINFGIANKYINNIKYIFVLLYICFAIYISIGNTALKNSVSIKILTTLHPVVRIFNMPNIFIKFLLNLAENIVLVYHENVILKQNNDKLKQYFIKQKLSYDNIIKSQELFDINSNISSNIKNFEISYISNGSKIVIIKTGDANIKEYSQVLCAGGLIGRVISSFNGLTKVVLINNSQSYIPVSTSVTGARGILSGDGVNIEMIDLTLTPKVGEIVYTLSMDDVFKSGTPVGVISKIYGKHIMIDLICDLSTLNQLSVVMD